MCAWPACLKRGHLRFPVCDRLHPVAGPVAASPRLNLPAFKTTHQFPQARLVVVAWRNPADEQVLGAPGNLLRVRLSIASRAAACTFVDTVLQRLPGRPPLRPVVHFGVRAARIVEVH